MKTQGFRSGLLNLATAAATVAAVVVVTSRIRGERRPVISPEFTMVADWRNYSDDGARFGPTTAQVTIVEFSDFACPHCRSAAIDLNSIRKRYRDDVTVLFRHFPLRDVSLQAAIAAECAAKYQAFEKMHDLLFAAQDSLGTKPWTRFAVDAGVADTISFARCMSDSTTVLPIMRDVKAGQALGVTGTPHLLVNERLFRGNPGLAFLRSHIDKLLDERKAR